MVEDEVNVQPTRPVIDDQTDGTGTAEGDDASVDGEGDVTSDEKTGLASLSL